MKIPENPLLLLLTSKYQTYLLTAGLQKVRIIGGAIGNRLQKYLGVSVEFWVLASPSEAAKEDSVLAVCIAVWTLAVWNPHGGQSKSYDLDISIDFRALEDPNYWRGNWK